MKRFLSLLFVALLSLTRPAFALPEDPSIAAMQATLADIGRWSLEQQSAMQLAAQPLAEIDAYIEILDRFAAGEVNARETTVALEAWRASALQSVAQAQAAATALREPPSMAQFGPTGAALESALHAARDGLLPTIHEFERVVNACVDLGLAAVRDPTKSFDVRQRALLQAQIQLVRVDTNRLRLTAAGLPVTHPTHALLEAMQHYYAALVAVPEYALVAMDGGGDRAAMIASLRQAGRNMRGSIARASTLSEQMRAQLAAQPAGQAPDLVRAVRQMFDSYPATVRAFTGLADNIDRAVAAIEAGEDALEVWGDQEEWDTPYLNEIDRLDRLRAQLMANVNGTL